MQCKTQVKVLIAVATVLAGLAIFLVLVIVSGIIDASKHNADSDQNAVGWTNGLSRDAAYTSSATLAGLAIFGSVLGVRLSTKTEAGSKRNAGVVTMLGGVIATVSIHGKFMHYACCQDFHEVWFGLMVIVTVIAMLAIVIGFTLIIEASIQRGGSSTSAQQT